MIGKNEATVSGGSFLSNFFASALRTKPLNSGPSNGLNPEEGLLRRLSLLDLILIGIGASIGAGIFVVTGTVAHDVGPGVTISFILAGFSCVLNGLCYAELSSRFPAVVGGAYLYTYTAFNELTAFLVFTQLMIDYHVGAASIARSLGTYVIALFELFPAIKGHIPGWLGHGTQLYLGIFSFNILAPILLILLTLVLCRGVKESSLLNAIMTSLKVIIVIIVICAGSFEVDIVHWSPFVPNGFRAVLTGATIVFFAYVGFDAVANSAEEAKKPQRDLPWGIMASILICAALYIGVCLVITGMVPYTNLGQDAPLATVFTTKGLKFVSILISIGAVAGLTTTLLVGLYVQSRLYMGIGRDGLLPTLFAKVNPARHTPIHSQIWVGTVAAVLAGLLDIRQLSHFLSVGSLTGYSVVAACVVTLRWTDKNEIRGSRRWISSWREGVLCLIIIASCGFAVGALYRFYAHFAFMIVAGIIAILTLAALCFRQSYTSPTGFSCPWVPIVPAACIFFNIFLFAQLHYEGWVRFVVLSIVSVGIYALYGQHHANPGSAK